MIMMMKKSHSNNLKKLKNIGRTVKQLKLTDLVGLDVRMNIGTYLAEQLQNPAFESLGSTQGLSWASVQVVEGLT